MGGGHLSEGESGGLDAPCVLAEFSREQASRLQVTAQQRSPAGCDADNSATWRVEYALRTVATGRTRPGFSAGESRKTSRANPRTMPTLFRATVGRRSSATEADKYGFCALMMQWCNAGFRTAIETNRYTYQGCRIQVVGFTLICHVDRRGPSIPTHYYRLSFSGMCCRFYTARYR